MNATAAFTDDSSVRDLKCIPLELIKSAKCTLEGQAIRTPLVPLNYDVGHGTKIYLKLENLQHTGSFKYRGACNVLSNLPHDVISQGVYAPSAGNFAQGLAFCAQEKGVPCTIVAPSNAPATKLDAIRQHRAGIIQVPYDTWWDVMQTGQFSQVSGHFLHPVCNKYIIAGHGTIGLEILEQLPEVDAIISPYGGGGLATGVASAMKALKPSVQVYACEVETASPLSISLKAGRPMTVENHRPSFVDGMGGKALLGDMWNMASHLISASLVVSLESVARAVQLLLERNHILAEGAGAATVAAALGRETHIKASNSVCIVSGGNIDTDVLLTILQGKTPE